MDPTKSLWMGNLDKGTDLNYIQKLFKQLSKFN